MKLNWLDETRPHAEAFDDIYYAEEDGLAESRYVFIGQNDLDRRFQETTDVFNIGELGFGTGLNFLATWQQWIGAKRNPNARLHYISCEKYPLSKEQIARALSRWPELNQLTQKFLRHYIELPHGFFRFAFEDDRIALSLLIGDAAKTLPELSAEIDAWYFDGFSPQKNPDLWSPEIFSQVARHSKAGTTFATYSATGFVRRNIMEAGFSVEKFIGFGRKREMLKGYYPSSTTTSNVRITSEKRRVAILGAGFAGCSVANALSNRGYEVTLLDRGPSLASEASGNAAGISLPALTAEPSLLSQLGFAGLVWLRSLQTELNAHVDQGLLQFADQELKLSKWTRGLDGSRVPTSFARLVSPDEASAKAGIPLKASGLIYEYSGTLSLPSLANKLLENSKGQLKVLLNTKILNIHREQNIWRLTEEGGKKIEAEILIICSAYDSLSLELTKHLPLRKIRGQIAEIECPELAGLKTPICFGQYITPQLTSSTHLLGATYDRENLDTEIRPDENQQMLKAISKFLKPYSLQSKVRSSRVSFRTSVPGQEPLAGELFDRYGSPLENAFILTALASRGSLYAGILAEMLAAKINGEPSPLPISVIRGLSPKRFSINADS